MDWRVFWRSGRASVLAPRAIVDVATGARLTFADVEAHANRLAAALAPMIAKGDRLALLMGNGPRYAEILFAALKLGAIVVPLNLRLTAGEIDYQLDDCRPALVVFDASNAALAGKLAG
jgi:acyl-CoA synthetase (AMP-forming)/AMP-acid ligase II